MRNLEGSILAWVTSFSDRTRLATLKSIRRFTIFLAGAMADDRLTEAMAVDRQMDMCLTRVLDQAWTVYMQTQAGYPLVKQDQSPTTEVHVFSKDWALQGDGYQGVYFSKGG